MPNAGSETRRCVSQDSQCAAIDSSTFGYMEKEENSRRRNMNQAFLRYHAIQEERLAIHMEMEGQETGRGWGGAGKSCRMSDFRQKRRCDAYARSGRPTRPLVEGRFHLAPNG
jgi:hypothetical protein